MTRFLTSLAAVFLGTLLGGAVFSFQPSLAQAPGATAVVLTGARVIDGTGRASLENATVLISNGRIEAVGGSATVRIPAGATRIDVSGKTIIPGLITAHAHVDANKESTMAVRDQLVGSLRLYGQYGVATAYSLGSSPIDDREGIKLRDEPPMDRARLYTAGGVVADQTPEEARKSVNRNADLKVDIIKIRVDGLDSDPNKMTPAIYRAVIDEAHKRGLRVAAHMYYLKDARGLLDAGVDILAHSVRDQDVDPAFIAEVKRRNVGYIPTLTRELSVFAYGSTPAFFSDPFFLRGQAFYGKQVEQLKDPARQEKTRSNPQTQIIKKALEQASRNLKLMADAGVTIGMGTDTGMNLLGRWQGYFEHIELELMVKAGLTPMQALVAATGDAARVMKLDRQLGTLQPGKWADLLVLNTNPLSDIRNTRQIDSVWIAGRRLADAN